LPNKQSPFVLQLSRDDWKTMRRRVLINASFVGAPRSLHKVIKIENDSAGPAAPRREDLRPLCIARVLHRAAMPRTGKSRSEIEFEFDA